MLEVDEELLVVDEELVNLLVVDGGLSGVDGGAELRAFILLAIPLDTLPVVNDELVNLLGVDASLLGFACSSIFIGILLKRLLEVDEELLVVDGVRRTGGEAGFSSSYSFTSSYSCFSISIFLGFIGSRRGFSSSSSIYFCCNSLSVSSAASSLAGFAST